MLFRDCLILSLGPWSSPLYKTIKEPVLAKFAASVHGKQALRVIEFYEALLQKTTSKDGEDTVAAQDILDLALECTNGYSLFFPLYFRACLQYSTRDFVSDSLKQFRCWLEPLLENKLFLHRGAVAGQGEFEDYFLNVEIPDEDLPVGNLSQFFCLLYAPP